jgi:hypothetical protein
VHRLYGLFLAFPGSEEALCIEDVCWILGGGDVWWKGARGSTGEVGAISPLKTEDDKFRVLIENSPKFLYELLRKGV